MPSWSKSGEWATRRSHPPRIEGGHTHDWVKLDAMTTPELAWRSIDASTPTLTGPMSSRTRSRIRHVDASVHVDRCFSSMLAPSAQGAPKNSWPYRGETIKFNHTKFRV